jgi:uncharacterized protein (TIGR02598 family)
MKSPFGEQDKSAFSMIEVTIAIGIVGFALLAVLGNINTGSNIQRQAINVTVQAQIMQGVAGSLRHSGWNLLTGFNEANLYFDERGIATDRVASIYKAMVVEPSSGRAFDLLLLEKEDSVGNAFLSFRFVYNFKDASRANTSNQLPLLVQMVMLAIDARPAARLANGIVPRNREVENWLHKLAGST